MDPASQPVVPASPAPAVLPATGPVSRRDFLRRAGREAVQTGTQLVPGAALAKTALGIGPTGADGAKPQSLMARLAGWRNKRGEATTEADSDAATPQTATNASDGAEGRQDP